jgi:K+-sensing histidine kinase KdpD
MLPPKLPAMVDAAAGALLCAVLASAVCAATLDAPYRTQVPILFMVVLMFTGAIFGMRAGVLGTILAAAIFAYFLLSPVGHLSVANQSARANLGWMVLVGLSFSYLFGPDAFLWRNNRTIRPQ